MKWILLVEDDLSLINGLSFAVKKQGYMLDVAHTKDEADRLWENGAYDLVILDVSLPDGFYVGQRWSSGCTLLVHNIDHSSFLFPTNINHYILLIIISGISFIYI